MICPCGGEVVESERMLLTLTGARKWFPDADVGDLPLGLRVKKCKCCGRLDKEWIMTAPPNSDRLNP